MTPNDVSGYASAVRGLLENDALYRKLQEGCAHSAENVSLEKMADRFCEGIELCLKQSSAMPLASSTP